MAIKNYTTTVPANKSIQEIQDSLVKHGAKGVLLEYEKGTGRIESLKFVLEMKGQDIGFRLPTNWRKFQQVIKNENNRRYNDEAYCYRVAWRCLRDWVLAQMALFETEMVDIPQVFLPYAISKNGANTLYEQVLASKFLLESGDN